MSGPKRWKKPLLIGLKLVVVIVLGFVLVRLIDWVEFWRSLKTTSPWAFTVAVLLNLISAAVMTSRWHLLILGSGQRISYRIVLAYTLLGMFFNQILPGSVSGDAARVLCLKGSQTSWKKSAGIVLWDRVLGLVALIIIVLVTIPLYWRYVLDGRAALLLWLIFFLGFVFFLSLQSRAVLGLVERLATGLWLRLGHGRSYPEALFAGLRSFLTNRGIMVKTFFLSLVVRGLWLLGGMILSRSMGLAVPLGYIFFAISLVELVRLVPVSIQGLGVRELAFVWFLAPLGVSAARAALLSMLFYTALTVAGLLGGLIYLLRRFWGGVADAG